MRLRALMLLLLASCTTPQPTDRQLTPEDPRNVEMALCDAEVVRYRAPVEEPDAPLFRRTVRCPRRPATPSFPIYLADPTCPVGWQEEEQHELIEYDELSKFLASLPAYHGKTVLLELLHYESRCHESRASLSWQDRNFITACAVPDGHHFYIDHRIFPPRTTVEVRTKFGPGYAPGALQECRLHNGRARILTTLDVQTRTSQGSTHHTLTLYPL